MIIAYKMDKASTGPDGKPIAAAFVKTTQKRLFGRLVNGYRLVYAAAEATQFTPAEAEAFCKAYFRFNEPVEIR